MLRIEELSYEIKGHRVLKDVSLQVRKGEVVALLGANGAGKSTLMRLISGELKPSSGNITLFDKRIDKYENRTLAQGRAMLSQQHAINMAYTVKELVVMGRYPHFQSSPSVKDWKIVQETMAICGVADFADRVYLSLSGGEQQRVQLARVLSQLWDNPDALLLLDEPISALDLHYQQKVLSIAKSLSRQGFMVLVILHDINMASLYADRIIMLKNGRKWLDGTPNEVLNDKNIYTIFSVESSISVDNHSLKPHIFFKEMHIEPSFFNSSLQPVPAEDFWRTDRTQIQEK
ncbi:heme ABC transporter ATP-binding protein [Sphingobacterium corticibacterium]|uniref:Heme ABC transporter ATP-binding protein n=1 Tax=Sphingobacterium corticibacterium TaxID=2484746 RepID=A0A4V2DCF9_9SPHI|nr:heme ABC transporter ATP-binding protein [Sphingobacterium corticibacterium]RZF61348.1 heme ABC transporter ATP-binding protein [Sphingobacterium corticibacterium]